MVSTGKVGQIIKKKSKMVFNIIFNILKKKIYYIYHTFFKIKIAYFFPICLIKFLF